jgi:hypothetical protein
MNLETNTENKLAKNIWNFHLDKITTYLFYIVMITECDTAHVLMKDTHFFFLK